MSLALWLRAGRVHRGMTLEDVARVTKIQTRILERLESGRPEGLPADVFVRGFVRSFAKCVGLDEDEALRRYCECGVASAPAVTARAMIEAMADLAPTTARAIPAPRSPLAAGSLQDLPKAEPEGEPAAAPVAPAVAPAPVVAAVTAAPVAAVPVAAPVVEIAPPVVAAPVATPAVEIAPAALAAVEIAPVAAAAAEIAPVTAEPAPAPAPAKKKRTRRTAAAAGASTSTTTTTGTGKGRGRRKALASGTPAEASPVVVAPAETPAVTSGEAPAVSAEAPALASEAPIAATAEPIPAAVEAIPAAAEATPSTASEPAADPTAMATATAVDPAEAAPVALTEATPAEATPADVTPAEAASVEAAPAEAAPAEAAAEDPATSATWRPKMPPAATQSVPPWRRPRHAAASALPVVPSLVIDDADPESAEQVLEERAAAKSVMTAAQRRSLLPRALLDREDRSARQGGLTLAVIILLIAATLTLSYLMRRPSSSGDGFTHRAAPAQSIG